MDPIFDGLDADMEIMDEDFDAVSIGIDESQMPENAMASFYSPNKQVHLIHDGSVYQNAQALLVETLIRFGEADENAKVSEVLESLNSSIKVV